MKISNLSILLVLIILLFNCKKDDSLTLPDLDSENPTDQEEPSVSTEEVYFSYQTHPDILNRNQVWIVLHNNNGVLVDYQNVSNQGLVEFKIEKENVPESFSVTEVSAIQQSNLSLHNLNSWTNVSKGSIWYKNMPEEDSSIRGNFEITIENIPEINGYSVFANYDRIQNDKGVIRLQEDGSNSLLIRDIIFVSEREALIQITDVDNNPTYLLVEPEFDDELFVDYSEFKNFDSYVTTEIPFNRFRM